MPADDSRRRPPDEVFDPLTAAERAKLRAQAPQPQQQPKPAGRVFWWLLLVAAAALLVWAMMNTGF